MIRGRRGATLGGQPAQVGVRVAIAAFVVMGSCLGYGDPVTGVIRKAALLRLPEPECVVRALASIEGLSGIEHQTEEGGRPITLTGIQAPTTIYRYPYRLGALEGDIYFQRDYAGRVQLRQTYLYGGDSIAPQSEIDRIYPVMLEIEERLRARCSVGAFEVQESCISVRCGTSAETVR